MTQLFPVLEIKIRELVTLFGIFPFKKNIDEFMQYNDPSSLLRELLIMVFDEQHSFENVPDLMFVYNIMYNGIHVMCVMNVFMVEIIYLEVNLDSHFEQHYLRYIWWSFE